MSADQSRAEIHAAIVTAFAQLQAEMPHATWTELERMIYREGFTAGALWANSKAQRIVRETLGSVTP